MATSVVASTYKIHCQHLVSIGIIPIAMYDTE